MQAKDQLDRDFHYRSLFRDLLAQPPYPVRRTWRRFFGGS
jgi:hypothetical protein